MKSRDYTRNLSHASFDEMKNLEWQANALHRATPTWSWLFTPTPAMRFASTVSALHWKTNRQFRSFG